MGGAIAIKLTERREGKEHMNRIGTICIFFVFSASAAWSSGMILASGARGPGFNSRSSPLAFEEGQILQRSNQESGSALEIALMLRREEKRF